MEWVFPFQHPLNPYYHHLRSAPTLLTLPWEVRQKIWKYVFTGGRAIYDDRAPFITKLSKSNCKSYREFYNESFPGCRRLPWGENDSDPFLTEVAKRYGYRYTMLKEREFFEDLCESECDEMRDAIDQELRKRQLKNWKLSVQGGLDPRVLRTCRQIYREAETLYRSQEVGLAILTHDFRLHRREGRPYQPIAQFELPPALNTMVTTLEHNGLTDLCRLFNDESALPNLRHFELRGKVRVLEEYQSEPASIDSLIELARRTWQPTNELFATKDRDYDEHADIKDGYSHKFYEWIAFLALECNRPDVIIDQCAVCWIIMPYESTYAGWEVKIDVQDTNDVEIREAMFRKVPFVKPANGIPKHGWKDGKVGDWGHVEKLWYESVDGWELQG